MRCIAGIAVMALHSGFSQQGSHVLSLEVVHEFYLGQDLVQ